MESEDGIGLASRNYGKIITQIKASAVCFYRKNGCYLAEYVTPDNKRVRKPFHEVVQEIPIIPDRSGRSRGIGIKKGPAPNPRRKRYNSSDRLNKKW